MTFLWAQLLTSIPYRPFDAIGSVARWRAGIRRWRCRGRDPRSGCRCPGWESRSLGRPLELEGVPTSGPSVVSVTCTPVALPPSSMPLPRLPETMQVRIRLLPPLEVIRIPLCRFGAGPPKAKMPPKVLNEASPLALP